MTALGLVGFLKLPKFTNNFVYYFINTLLRAHLIIGVRLGDSIFRHTRNVNKNNFLKWSAVSSTHKNEILRMGKNAIDIALQKIDSINQCLESIGKVWLKHKFLSLKIEVTDWCLFKILFIYV